MARLAKENEQPVSLFPVFNILICTLGCLIFIISAVTTVSLGIGKTIAIETEEISGARHKKTPTYIEWDGRHVILHPEMDTVSIIIDKSHFDTDEELFKQIDSQVEGTSFGSLLRAIQIEHNRRYIVVLLRPSGFDNFWYFIPYLEDKKIDIGYEPMDQGWLLKVK